MSDNSAPKRRSKTDWKKRSVCEGITLDSGTIVDIELPNLPKMLKGGQIPQALIEPAIKHQNATKITRELLEETWDFAKFIVPRMLVKPTVTEEDVDDLPVEDVELLAAFASRAVAIDAVGHHLHGLETQQGFRDLHGIITTDPDLLD